MKFFDKAVRQFFSIVLLCAAAQAYEYGPDPGYTGAPGDQPSCAVGGSCHVGTPNSYTPGGVKIVLPGGSNTYVPGQTMTIQVQITDARMKSYGFQLTARLASNAQAGSFTPGADGYTQVLCASGAVLNPGSSCPQLFPVQDIEHTEAGWSASIKGGTGGSFTYTFTWTPPAAGAGNVTMYIAANSGTGAPAVTPTDVFTAHVTLTPAASAAGTTTTLTSSANPSAFGQNFSLSATVTPAAATGSVTFSDGSTGLSLGSATLINGTATLTVSQCLAAGAHPITAAYGGDSNDAASTSSVLSETINQGTTAPVLKTSGVVPLYSTSNNIEAGSWISLFGCNLYAGAASPGYALWNGTFPIPTNLGGVNVNIDGKPAFLWFASPSQINVQVPNDATLGQVSVNVTTAAGGTSNSVTAVLSAIAPSLVLFDATHVAGVIPTPDGSGHYGGGAYDLLGPSSSPFGFNTRPAKKGETVELFGVGFGPTQTPAPAGQQITASAITSTISATVGGASATAAGAIVLPGEYQVNVTIPANAASGDQPLTMTVGGVALLQSNLVIPVQ